MRLILTELPLALESVSANFDAVEREIVNSQIVPAEGDLLLLPELIGFESSPANYEASVRDLARNLGCHVVGGSHHRRSAGRRLNCGLAVSPRGAVHGRYEKRYPYGGAADAQPGSAWPPFSIAGRTIQVLVCADFWYANLWLEAARTDLVLVPALSVSRKKTPDYSRQLWRHMAISRAYEFAAYIGVSDFAPGWPRREHGASGVAGFADPTTNCPTAFFRPVGSARVGGFTLAFEALDAFRADRAERGFLVVREEPCSRPSEPRT